MNFTHPFLFWGLIALVIPIIIHLFDFRKAKLIKFSNVNFLHDVKKKSSSKLQLKHLLTLLARLLFLFFLVVTFAQPFIPSKENGMNGQSVMLYMDNSYSMTNTTAKDVAMLDQARSVAEQVVNLYPETMSFKVLDNDFKPESNYNKNKAKTLDIVATQQYSSIDRNFTEITAKLQDLNQEGLPSDIYIISDFQKSTFGAIDLQDSINQYHIIQSRASNQSNVYVDTLYFDNPFIFSHRDNTLFVKFKNDGLEAVKDLLIKLYLNEQQNASITIDIAAQSTKTLSFELGQSIKARNFGMISIEEFPVTFDNDFHFAFNQASKIRIAEIKGSKEKSHIQNVFEDNNLFSIKSFFENEILFEEVEKSDLLVINSVSNMTPGIRSQIKAYTKQDKAVLFIPRAEANKEDFPDFAKQLITQIDSSTQMSLKKPDLKNPFFDLIFESLEDNIKMPLAETNFKISGRTLPILSLKDGKPYLTKISSKQNLYILATPLDESYTNFHKHALFVPILQRIAELSNASSNKLYHRIEDDNILIKLDTILSQSTYRLVSKSDVKKEIIPSQRRFANQLNIDAPKYLLESGIYTLKIDTLNLSNIAFNIPKPESQLALYSNEEISSKLSAKNVHVLSEADPQSFASDMKEKYHSIELWKYALILSLVFLSIETLLLRFL